jgi:hypothetical protein
MAKRSKVERAKRSIRVTVTMSPAAMSFGGLCSSRRSALAVDLHAPGRTQLLELSIKGLPKGTDSRASDDRFHIFPS